jgi:hypothetical protein
MHADHRMSDDENCPVGDELLGEMYRASEASLPVLVATVEPDLRAMLALFCYHRSHLHSLGRSIAASCSADELVRVGGAVGAALFATSREPVPPKPGTYYSNRRKVTLSTGSIRKMAPLDDDDGDEAVA